MTATAAPRAGSPDPAARRATDQVDPYALIERAEALLGSDPHDAVVYALRAQAVARARTAEALMARAHFVAGAALMQVGDWTDAMRQLSQAQRFYTAQKDFGAQCKVLTQLAVACCELGEYSEALDGFSQALVLVREHG
jgi:tetratricopeptide (TPR) repeat protein